MLVRANPQVNMTLLGNRIQPLNSELSAARSHLHTVRRRLASAFDTSKVVLIGSHARGSAIRWHSDLDVMVVLRRNEAKWGGSVMESATVLRKVKDDLQDRYVATEVRRDQQAVVLSFASGQQSLDVVPALFTRFERLQPIYVIPDGRGQWLETSPEAHNRLIRAAIVRSGGKLRKVSQLLRWWKFSRTRPVPIQSCHVDLLLADTGTCVGVKSYPECLYEAFKLLAERECRPLRNPLGIGGVVAAAQTDWQREETNQAIRLAVAHSRAALVAAASGHLDEANRQWGIVFNGQY